MISKLKSFTNVISNMGWRYTFFRVKYELQRKSGTLQKKFPTNPHVVEFLGLEEFRKQYPNYFFRSREDIKLPKNPNPELQKAFENIQKGIYPFFSAFEYDLSQFNWITNPDTEYQYDIQQHSLSLENLNKEAGDIKYVWERARFSYLYTLIRYDYHFNTDCSEMVFSQIEDFIQQNPINQGPNYNCSQEISIRVYNWIFALYYYKNSPNLTEKRFQSILNSIYWQIHHVYQNIDFSRIAVRNNHAITETLALYVVPTLFPTMPNAKKWKEQGKKWFEQEVEYQIYEDGTFLQFSMNYHRVVIQLLTLGIQIANLNGERFSDVVYDRAKKSVDFLTACQDEKTGWLPNYGANDGALFFPLSQLDYRNYKPQLYALSSLLEIGWKGSISEAEKEDVYWFGIQNLAQVISYPNTSIKTFDKGGYFIVRENDTISFVRCGSYKDRPVQADNLHLDIWVNGTNILWDAGSYKYNTSEEEINYFNGTASHNTLMLGDHNQMLKGARFIWNNWIKEAKGFLTETETEFVFKGYFVGFQDMGGVKHSRTIIKTKGKNQWKIIDEVDKNAGETVKVNWHLNPEVIQNIDLTIENQKDSWVKKESSVSNYYGLKEKSWHWQYPTQETKIITHLNYK